MSLFRAGLSTGTCAAAAAKAAAMVLTGAIRVGSRPALPAAHHRGMAWEPFQGSHIMSEVDIGLPDGSRVRLAVVRAASIGEAGEAQAAEATVRKDAGDDPDVTHAAEIVVRVSRADHSEIRFRAGEGVGMVTRPGLSVPPGEPAINPVPRAMISAAIREVTTIGVDVTVAIPGGAELAAKTFNPRLGVVGGLSILGTTGRVRPFSTDAVQETVRCLVRVAQACGIVAPVLVPGHIGERAAHRHFRLAPEQVLEVSNAWGFVLDEARGAQFERLLLVGHPGKLGKLAQGHWDTHSSRSEGALSSIARLAQVELGIVVPDRPTVEGLFAGLPDESRGRLARTLAARVQTAVATRSVSPVAVVLVDMQGDILGSAGEITPWQ
jgi:cobalt-precorrin-5B (C1)-methyltransferase